MKPYPLGRWRAPSGADVVAHFLPARGDGVREVALEWSVAPPLDPRDEADYRDRIRPELIARVEALLELAPVGPRIVVQL